MLQNEYLLIHNEVGDIVDKYRYDGEKLNRLVRKINFDSQILGKIKPKNIKQELFFDLLDDSKVPVKIVSGVAGSGKTFLSTAWALQEIQKGKFNKIVVIRNNVAVKDVPDIGALPGDATEKLMGYCAFMMDIVTPFMFESLLHDNKIEVAWLGSMRGRSLSDSIILVSEAQNLTTNLVKMLITRVAENSVIIFDYDLEQIDKSNFEKDNGMLRLTESLKGHPLFGMVELDLIERSAVARMAELIK